VVATAAKEGDQYCTTARYVSKRAALHGAVQNGREAVVRLLLENGADVSVENKFEWIVLHTAIRE
jgi:ankyrin repeat protein